MLKDIYDSGLLELEQLLGNFAGLFPIWLNHGTPAPQSALVGGWFVFVSANPADRTHLINIWEGKEERRDVNM